MLDLSEKQYANALKNPKKYVWTIMCKTDPDRMNRYNNMYIEGFKGYESLFEAYEQVQAFTEKELIKIINSHFFKSEKKRIEDRLTN